MPVLPGNVGWDDWELMDTSFPIYPWRLNLAEHDFGDMTYPFLISGQDLELYASLR